MAEFSKAHEKTMKAEGGFVLHEVPGDTGGQTFAGIARNKNPQWVGWPLIDKGDMEGAKAAVAEFYRVHYWNPMKGDELKSQAVAESIYDFGVNSGVGTAVKLAQATVGVGADGKIGPATLAALNLENGAEFAYRFAVAKVQRYANICNKNRDQSKFLLGWINRTLNQLKG